MHSETTKVQVLLFQVPFPPVKMKMPGRPKTERRREEQEKPKGNKLSRKGCIQRCSMCGSENHNKRKCIGNPDVVTEYAEKKKAAKRSRKKREEAATQASSSGQQQERHVLYVEKKSTSKKEAPRHTQQQAPRHAQQQAPRHTQQQAPRHAEQHAQPRPRPFVPPKKKQIPKSYDGASQSSASLQIPRRQTIPMCEVVTESVPKHGRLRWYFGGNERTNEGGEGGDGQE